MCGIEKNSIAISFILVLMAMNKDYNSVKMVG